MISICTDLPELEKRSKDWEELLRKSNCFRLFSGPFWLARACEVFGLAPFVVYAMENDELKAVLPLVYDQRSTARVFEFPAALYGEWFDIVGIPGGNEPYAKQILLSIVKLMNSGDELRLVNLSQDSTLLLGLSELLDEDHEPIDHQLQIRFPAPYVNVQQGWESYLSTKSQNFRSKAKKLIRQFQGLGLSCVPFDRSGFTAKDVVKFLIDNSIERFDKNSIFLRDLAQKFTLETHAHALETKEMTADLWLDGSNRIKACLFYVKRSNENLLLHFAYDTALRDHGIGRYLIFHGILKTAQDGLDICDFARTTSSLKERIQTGTRHSIGLSLKR